MVVVVVVVVVVFTRSDDGGNSSGDGADDNDDGGDECGGGSGHRNSNENDDEGVGSNGGVVAMIKMTFLETGGGGIFNVTRCCRAAHGCSKGKKKPDGNSKETRHYSDCNFSIFRFHQPGCLL